LQAALTLQRELARARLAVTAIDATAPSRLAAILADRPYRLVVGVGEVRERVARYLQMRSEIDAGGADLRAVDLRFEGQVVLRRLEGSASEP
jgi:predicted TIM-barrel fold metal-dependent hydrolase